MTPAVREILAELAKVRALPRSQARTVSASYYTCPQFLELEKEALFRKEWICVGHEGEVAKPGDYFTTEIVDEQLLVVRGPDGKVRVLSNVCRHRGNMVVHGAGNTPRLTCGYHSWSYRLDGSLLAAPRMEGMDKSTCRLPSFAMEIWQGFIFVNLSGEAATLEPALADMEPVIRNYRSQEKRFLFGSEATWHTNWKCLVENFMEGYHLSSTHAKTLHESTPSSLAEKLPGGPGFTGFRSNYDPAYSQGVAPGAEMSAVERRSSALYCIFPSFVVSFAPAFTEYMCIRPLTADTVGIRWGVLGIADPESASVQEELKVLKQVYEEDRAMLEGLQKGLKSRFYGHGPLAGENLEGTIWDILQYMAGRLGGAAVIQNP